MAANQRGEQCLLFSRETGQIGGGHDVLPVFMVLLVSYIEADLVKVGRPANQLARGSTQSPGTRNLEQEAVRSTLEACS